MPDNLKVLLIAEAANPEWASVPLEGWSLSQAISRITHAHVVTHVRNRDAFLRSGLTEGIQFTTIDNEFIARPVWKLAEKLRGGAGKGWTTIMAFSSLIYYSFESQLWKIFKQRLMSREFDIVHRITPLSPTTPSLLANHLVRAGIPFIMGPLNGGVPWPRNFIDRQHAEKEWLAHVRSVYKLLPGYRSTRKNSTAIIAGSRHTYEEMPNWVKHKLVYIPENGVDIARFNNVRDRIAAFPLKIAFVGRLVPYKGADILLEAISALLKDDKVELHIIGDGPERARLEEIVRRERITPRVTFHGWLPHTAVQDALRACDLLALPSVREFGGAVVVESMALGLTPVVADYGGPGELVDDDTGVRVPFTDKDSLVAGMRRAIADFVLHPDKLDRFGRAGREKILKKLTWDAKARQIAEVYKAVIAGSKDLRSLDFK
jgi:glycosyltransferase involved in cell wall biosynthesis